MFAGASPNAKMPAGMFAGASPVAEMPAGRFAGASPVAETPAGRFAGAARIAETSAGRFAGATANLGAPAFAGARLNEGAPAFAGVRAKTLRPAKSLPKIFPRARQRQRGDRRAALLRVAALPGVSLSLGLAFFAAVGLYGAHRGGEYAAFVKANGAPADIAARLLGFGLNTVSISGQIELSEAQILKAAGIDSLQSLPFLDADAVRTRLMTLPLVKNARIRKLLPDKLLIEISERTPHAVWQDGGALKIVAADGAPIDDFRDARYERLPFVVGEGANQRIDEYQALLDAAGPLRGKIRAGALVSQRRWTLSMKNGVEVLLPEFGAAQALRQLAKLDADDHILDKAIISLDFRTPGRLFVRLTEEAAAARAAAHAPRKGAPK
jgi:cell division protein FtsQ